MKRKRSAENISKRMLRAGSSSPVLHVMALEDTTEQTDGEDSPNVQRVKGPVENAINQKKNLARALEALAGTSCEDCKHVSACKAKSIILQLCEKYERKERHEDLMNVIKRASNNIYKNTNRGAANYIITSEKNYETMKNAINEQKRKSKKSN